MYDNCKGNKDYDLKSNNEIAKVEQLEIEIGKSMMSSVFWEMWNKNHGEIDEKVWVNQKKKMKDEIRVCDLYLIGAKKHNTKRDEESQNRDQLIPNQSCAIMYLIDDRRALWDFLDRRALWDFYTFLVSGF